MPWAAVFRPAVGVISLSGIIGEFISEEAMGYPKIEATAGQAVGSPRHSAVVRITHWLIVLSVLGLLVSGIGILISHPRLYWGRNRQYWDRVPR